MRVPILEEDPRIADLPAQSALRLRVGAGIARASQAAWSG